MGTNRKWMVQDILVPSDIEYSGVIWQSNLLSNNSALFYIIYNNVPTIVLFIIEDIYSEYQK